MCGCGQLNNVFINHLDCAITANQISHGMETETQHFYLASSLRISLILAIGLYMCLQLCVYNYCTHTVAMDLLLTLV